MRMHRTEPVPIAYAADELVLYPERQPDGSVSWVSDPGPYQPSSWFSLIFRLLGAILLFFGRLLIRVLTWACIVAFYAIVFGACLLFFGLVFGIGA